MIQLVLFAIVGERLRVGLTAGPIAELMKAVRISESGHDPGIGLSWGLRMGPERNFFDLKVMPQYL
jgi:hypothetical protein